MSQGKRTVSRVIAGVIAAIVVAAAIATGLSAKALSNALDNQGKLPDDAESAQSADSGASDGAQSSSSDVPAGSTGADSGLYHTVPSADHDVVDEDTGLRFIDNELVVYVKGGTDSEEFMDCYVYSCGSCGGEVIINGSEASTKCIYCGNSTVIFNRISRQKRPKYIIPFIITKEEAEQRGRNSQSRRQTYRVLCKSRKDDNQESAAGCIENAFR